ncbi:MAG TPA: hypothetical protein VHT03_06185 [Rhizomicrobium sp.]|jgi:hypothetical protein|nr:hypothetical protein [Rhizomicrobium sp.]
MNNDKVQGMTGPAERAGAVESLAGRSALRLIWAEKTAFALLLAETVLVAFLWLISFLAAGNAGANHVLASIGEWRVEQGFLSILALWMSFRAMDFIVGGSTYRLFARLTAAARSLPTASHATD